MSNDHTGCDLNTHPHRPRWALVGSYAAPDHIRESGVTIMALPDDPGVKYDDDKLKLTDSILRIPQRSLWLIDIVFHSMGLVCEPA